MHLCVRLQKRRTRKCDQSIQTSPSHESVSRLPVLRKSSSKLVVADIVHAHQVDEAVNSKAPKHHLVLIPNPFNRASPAPSVADTDSTYTDATSPIGLWLDFPVRIVAFYWTME